MSKQPYRMFASNGVQNIQADQQTEHKSKARPNRTRCFFVSYAFKIWHYSSVSKTISSYCTADRIFVLLEAEIHERLPLGKKMTTSQRKVEVILQQPTVSSAPLKRRILLYDFGTVQVSYFKMEFNGVNGFVCQLSTFDFWWQKSNLPVWNFTSLKFGKWKVSSRQLCHCGLQSHVLWRVLPSSLQGCISWRALMPQ